MRDQFWRCENKRRQPTAKKQHADVLWWHLWGGTRKIRFLLEGPFHFPCGREALRSTHTQLDVSGSCSLLALDRRVLPEGPGKWNASSLPKRVPGSFSCMYGLRHPLAYGPESYLPLLVQLGKGSGGRVAAILFYFPRPKHLGCVH